jgi:8-amino-7-oxononanoate synthase
MPDARRVAQEIAALQGCERGTLGTSTLHLFWDLFGSLAGRQVVIYMDDGVYPIVRWGVERAAACGVAVRTFSHHDPDALSRLLRQPSARGLRPVVVTDGFCPGCGEAAPLAAYRDHLRPFGGRLILDDTQALGIFGQSPCEQLPYGKGGGGMLVAGKISGTDVLAVSSLAKAFGVPAAVLVGSNSAVEEFERNSQTRVHCSPPSTVVVYAAQHALAVNRERGDLLRLRLARLVSRFRQRMAEAAFRFTKGLFPVQTLVPSAGLDVAQMYQRLLERGVRTVLHRARNGHGARISFLITARHTPEAIDRAAAAISEGRNTRNYSRGEWHEGIAWN